ncbi:putative tRNA(Ile)lysidine synthase [Bodo saltans virus]|uniref:tRNA(Ile)-lysidine synthetase n=1 Tax=Bodo saltans virus TaxID=2024608 RepID=A0A2H4UTJ2_9VIRU|nr:putative tRNA(Ile)lysidine synthase [Bodo saltans virus]ATZ80260.1 putative tRNA(Ile)lysidine synthase [Bodo saltans virus]
MMQKLFNFWFNGEYQNFWFDGSRDEKIFELFHTELKELEDKKSTLDIRNMSLETKLYHIIMFDQITRNISRITKEDEKRNDSIAFRLSLSIFIYDNEIYNYSFDKIIFVLMPFRHTDNSSHLEYIISKLNTLKKIITEKDNELYTKFYMATLKSYTDKMDTIKIFNSSDKCKQNDIDYNDLLHDDNCKKYKNKQLNAGKLKILNNALYYSVRDFVKKYNMRRIGVSLSGGVDSMVLLNILHHMMLNGIIDIVVAIHIDYRFRDEMYDEALFLRNYCIHMGIEFVTRDVLHFQNVQINIPRTFIEDETKNMRFNLYRYAANKFNLGGICLGHHKGDLIENVFMNIMKGRNILDLFMMEEIVENKNVVILRPMLDHNKEIILNIAHENNILYFKDTTPKWSFRGSIRDNIFPAICKFDETMLNNLYNIGHQSRQWKRIMYTNIIKPIINSVEIYEDGFSIMINYENDSFDYVVWTEILSTIFHNKIGKQMMGHKNVNMFIKWYDMKKISLFRTSNGYIAVNDVINKKVYFIKIENYNGIKDIEKHNGQVKIKKIIENFK